MEDSFSNQINNAPDDESTPYVTPADPRASLARKLALIFVSVSLVLAGVTSVSLLNSEGDD